MGIITLAGIDIDVWEGGDGPPLLFLHGAGGFRPGPAYLDLLGRHRRVIAPSHPGFGVSGLGDWMDRPDDIAHLYLELLYPLNIGELDIMGASFGGWIAAELGPTSGTSAPPGAGRPRRGEYRQSRRTRYSQHLRPAGGRSAAHDGCRAGGVPRLSVRHVRTRNCASCCAIANPSPCSRGSRIFTIPSCHIACTA